MNQNSKLEYVFILGAGRSGTKFLRGLLDVSKQVVTIPYDIGYIWRYGNESLSHDQLTPDMARENIQKYVRKMLPKLVKSDKEGARFLVEKSVPNTLRPEFLQKIYPNAKFIHLIRDGRAVTESSIRMWSEPVNRSYLIDKIRYFPWSNYKYALWYFGNIIKGAFSGRKGNYIWGPRYKGIEEDITKLPLAVVCARQWRMSVEVAAAQLVKVPSENVLEVRYEALVSDVSQVKRVCDFIGIVDSDVVVDHYKKTVKASNLDKWRETLSAERLDLVNKEIGELIASLGYTE